MCELARVSRASFYRSYHQQQPVTEELEVRSAIQQIAIEHRRRYGYRRISAELRRRGMQVNHKRVMRIMAEDNLLAAQPRSFVVTTNSDHEFEVYLNLASRMKLTGINQLSVALRVICFWSFNQRVRGSSSSAAQHFLRFCSLFSID